MRTPPPKGIFRIATAFCLLILCHRALAGCDAVLDTTFSDLQLGYNGGNASISTFVVQSDGRILIGGLFTKVNGVSHGGIARLNYDGTLDTTFLSTPGADFRVSSMALQPDGKIVMAGGFTNYNGAHRVVLARINPDGTLDGSFTSRDFVPANAVIVQPDGKIVVAGIQSRNGSTPVANTKVTTRLNSDGTFDTSFTRIFSTDTDGDISVAALQPDGRILIGGTFTQINGISRNHIARLNSDGTLDVSFDPGSGFRLTTSNMPNLVFTLQPDGQIVVAGTFDQFNGVARTGIARLTGNGALDPSFNPSISGGFSGQRSGLALQPDGRIVIAGAFTKVSGVDRNGIARLNPDGSLDTSFDPGSGASYPEEVVLQPDGKVLLSGYFSDYNGTTRNGLARLLGVNCGSSLPQPTPSPSIPPTPTATPFPTPVPTPVPSGTPTIDPTGCPGVLDPSAKVNLNGSSGSGTVNATAKQPDGKILIGGAFSEYNGVNRINLARVNADGSPDTSFDPQVSANAPINAIAIQPDGGILIGGEFTAYNNVSRLHLARLNSDGTLDLSFNPGAGPTGNADGVTVRSMAIQGDGKILVVGNFTQYNGAPRGGVVRINSDGSLDSSFNPGSGTTDQFGNPQGGIYTVSVQSDGKVLLSGGFTLFNGTASNGLVRLKPDGSLDTSFTAASTPSHYTLTVLQPDGKVLAAAGFSAPVTLVRLNGDGSLDSSFNALQISGTISGLALQPNGRLFVIGTFTDVNGVGRSGIARLNSDGSLDTSFDPGAGANGNVGSISTQPDGKVFIFGTFTQINGAARNRAAFLNPDGSLDTSTTLGSGLLSPPIIYDFAVQPDGKIIVAGNFTDIDGVSRGGIARVFPDGSLDPSFDPGTGARQNTPNSPVIPILAVALQLDGKVLIGGAFNVFNGSSHSSITRLNPDGSVDRSFDTGGADNIVRAIVLQPDGTILVGGDFDFYNGVRRSRLARLTRDGVVDFSFVSSANNGTVFAIAPQADGKIVAGGDFTSFSGSARNRLARVNSDGSLDTSFDPGTGANDSVRTVALQADGRILAGGRFSQFNAVTRNTIARLNGDGSLDNSFDPGVGTNGIVSTIAVQPDTRILIGGSFTQLDGVRRNRIARLNPNGSLDPLFDQSAGVSASVLKIIVQPDGRVLASGNFTQSNDTTVAGLARINGDATCVTTAIPASRLLNIATRLPVQSGDNVLIGGFIITGTESKKVLILGVGPSLAQFFTGSLADPTLELYQGNTLLQMNDNWKTDQQAEIEATGIPPSNELESAIVRTLDPGSYTAILRGAGGATGIGVVQAYDLNQAANSKFGNIATRGFIDSGDNAMIGGFIIGPAGGATTTVVVRAIGPSLTDFGVAGALPDPTVELHDGNGATIAFNDNWADDSSQGSIPQPLKPADAHESALLRALAPGSYTAIVRGNGNSTGIGLVEVYNLQ